MKNDPHTENRNKAIQIKKHFDRKFNKLRIQARTGDNSAALLILDALIEYHQKLKDIGYRTTSEDEPGVAGRVVARTQEWIDAQKPKNAIRELMKAAMDGDPEAIAKFLEIK